jgi:hypothetical protein
LTKYKNTLRHFVGRIFSVFYFVDGRADILITDENKPGGLGGLRGFWLALLLLRMVITPPLTQQSQRFEPTTMHYTTIDPKIKRFEPTTMHYTTID